MKSRYFLFKWFLFLFIFLLGVNSGRIGNCQADVLIIANPSVNTEKMSKEEIKNIFTGKVITWPNDTEIKLITLKTGPTHIEFVSDYTDKSETQFKRFWRNQTFTGKGIEPISVDTEEEILGFVAHTAGAIGYISSTTKPNGVKVIGITD